MNLMTATWHQLIVCSLGWNWIKTGGEAGWGGLAESTPPFSIPSFFYVFFFLRLCYFSRASCVCAKLHLNRLLCFPCAANRSLVSSMLSGIDTTGALSYIYININIHIHTTSHAIFFQTHLENIKYPNNTCKMMGFFIYIFYEFFNESWLFWKKM